MTDFETFRETLEEDTETMLGRLGSSRALFADTHGELETEPVLVAAATAERAARDTFREWAADEPHDAASAFFDRVANQEDDHYETVCEMMATAEFDPADVPALHVHLRTLEATVDRIGAFVGRCLVSKRSKNQMIGFFVGNADPQTAAVFRSFGEDLDEQLQTGADVFEAVCTDAQATTQARSAGTWAIEVTYDEYVENLEAQGVNPKPVC